MPALLDNLMVFGRLLRGLGLDVTVVEAAAQPMERVLPASIGSFVADLHRANGVDVRLGVGVTGLERRGDGEGERVSGVRLHDGSMIEADVVVVGLPHAEWGQVVVAAYPVPSRPDQVKLAQLVAQLAPAKRPKHFLPLESWPLTSAGKVNRAEVVRLAGAVLLSGGKAR